MFAALFAMALAKPSNYYGYGGSVVAPYYSSYGAYPIHAIAPVHTVGAYPLAHAYSPAAYTAYHAPLISAW